MKRAVDIVGKKYGYLTVIERAGSRTKEAMWLCECDCGNKKIVSGGALRSGRTTSCGCKVQAIMAQSKRNRNVKRLQKAQNTYDFYDSYVIGHTNRGESFIIDTEDYDNVKKYTWSVDQSGYVVANGRKKMRLHRYVTEAYDGNNRHFLIDHINHNKADNRKRNLRPVTDSQNQMNSIVRSNNTSGFKGVSWHKSKNAWISQIQINGKLKYLGLFQNIEDAVKARVNAEKMYFSDYNYDPSKWDLVNVGQK